jgi:hypothetical protein
METDFVHGAVRLKFLNTIAKDFPQTSLWEICGGQSGNGKVFFSQCFGFRHVVAQFVEKLSYKPEGRGFDSRWRH